MNHGRRGCNRTKGGSGRGSSRGFSAVTPCEEMVMIEPVHGNKLFLTFSEV